MGGPIVRTGTTPEFWKNWDNVFGDKSKGKGKKVASTKQSGASKKAGKKKAGKVARKKSGKR